MYIPHMRHSTLLDTTQLLELGANVHQAFPHQISVTPLTDIQNVRVLQR